MIDHNKSKEKVVIVGVFENQIIGLEDLDELGFLVETAGGKVVAKLTQRMLHPDPRYIIGKGKLNELKNIVKRQNADTVVFDNDLKPSQVRNLSQKLPECKILDRSGLILDIFASRAHTAEAKVQVNLAQLEYLLPRLSGMWEHLERQRGGIGMRGPGEKQIESDKRVIQKRITELKKKLEKLEKQRKTRRSRRFSQKRVALIGYTNAGKSTLLNKLTGADAYVEDKLFATLDPTTRRLVDSKGFISEEQSTLLLTDTVGFIKKLPHDLIESFKSTLGEAKESDLLMIVADISHEALVEHIETVSNILKELKLDKKESILVLNKADRLSKDDVKSIRRKFPFAITVSAKTGEGLGYLESKLFEILVDGVKVNLSNEYIDKLIYSGEIDEAVESDSSLSK
ncbi:MAG: GTPase HflX [Candidatus Zixiibacteriota bacterium]